MNCLTLRFSLPPVALPRAGRKHWAVARRERTDAVLGAIAAGVPALGHAHGEAVVLLTRVTTRGRADTDNLSTAFKHARDGIADALTRECRRHRNRCGPLHDGPGSGLRFEYAHTVGPRAETRVEVTVEAPPDPDAPAAGRA